MQLKITKILNLFCNPRSFGCVVPILLWAISIVILVKFLSISSIGIFISLGIVYIIWVISMFSPQIFNGRGYCNMCHKWYLGKYVETEVIVKTYNKFWEDSPYKSKEKICLECDKKQKEDPNYKRYEN